MSNRQSVKELLQADCGALLTGMGQPLCQTAVIIEHKPRAHLGSFVTRHHTYVTGKEERKPTEITQTSAN